MKNKSLLWGYICLAIVSVFWGTTYFALRIGVETFPPFLFSGLRQFIAGIVMLGVLFIMRQVKALSLKDILTQTLIGFLMIALGNGVIGWSERYIPSGLAAMIVSILPVYVVLINFTTGIEKIRPNAHIVVGLLLGCIGVVLIFKDNLKDIFNQDYLVGMLMCFAACLMWALGSIFSKKKSRQDVNPLLNAGLQMIGGGTSLLLMSVFLDDYSELQVIHMESIYAMLYLIIFGSLLAYSAFVYSLKVLPVEIASLYAYLNPFIALLLGYFLLNEPMTWMTLWALIFVLGGVYFINKGSSKKV